MNRHRVWIELEHPESAEEGQAIAVKFNRMMARLGQTEGWQLSWDEASRRFVWGGDMGAKVLDDWGNWFNLDYLGREE